MLRPRGATVWPARPQRGGEGVGQIGGALDHVVEAGRGEHLVGAQRERDRLARDRRVEAAPTGTEGRLQPAGGVRERHVAGRDRAHALAELRVQPQQPGAVRAAQPLLARGGVGHAAERLDVDRHGAGALRAVEDHRDGHRGQLLRRELARDPVHVRGGHERRGRADGVGELGERHRTHGRAAVARGDQRAEQPWVLVVGGDDLVARADVHPGQDAAEPVARARRDRDVVLLGADQGRVARAQVVRERVPALEVRPQAALADRRVELPPRQLDGGAGDRPVRARVEVRDPFEDGELVTEGHPFDPSDRRRARARRPRARTAARRAYSARPRWRRPGCPRRRRSARSRA